jgi:hypothetical protein
MSVLTPLLFNDLRIFPFPPVYPPLLLMNPFLNYSFSKCSEAGLHISDFKRGLHIPVLYSRKAFVARRDTAVPSINMMYLIISEYEERSEYVPSELLNSRY